MLVYAVARVDPAGSRLYDRTENKTADEEWGVLLL